MSKRVLKYPLPFGGGKVSMPADSQILTVHEQDGQITLWAEVDEASMLYVRDFEIVPTGGHVPENWEYLGTAFIDWMVWHVYEVR